MRETVVHHLKDEKRKHNVTTFDDYIATWLSAIHPIHLTSRHSTLFPKAKTALKETRIKDVDMKTKSNLQIKCNSSGPIWWIFRATSKKEDKVFCNQSATNPKENKPILLRHVYLTLPELHCLTT